MILQKSVFSDKHLVRISRPSWTFSRSLHSILTSGELEPNILFGEPVSPAGGYPIYHTWVYLVFASLIIPALATRHLRGAPRLFAAYALGGLGYLTGLIASS